MAPSDSPAHDPRTRDPRTQDPRAIDRREAIRLCGLIFGGVTVVGGTSLLSACGPADWSAIATAESIGDFSAGDIAFLDEVAETILPETDTPGAKAAAVGAFIALMVTATLEPEDQAIVRAGMATLDQECIEETGRAFVDATPAERLTLLERLDQEQFDYEPSGDVDPSVHYFRMIKQLTLRGYFTSEIGCTMAQQYVESPGRFEPCTPYEEGDRSWAEHA